MRSIYTANHSNLSAINGSACMDYYNMVDMCSWDFILKIAVLSLITLAIILGNSLVITAVFLYQKLRKSISNSFIASLAVADLILAVIVLPFSLTLEALSYWPFGTVMCKIWLVVDVWVCTASILHLCAISMDRFIAIAYPLRYPNLLTHRRCRLLCLVLWVVSFIICFPALLDWSADNNQIVHTNRSETDLKPLNTLYSREPPQCSVITGNTIGYVIYSALGSFFIPSAVMTAFYVKIFLLARRFLEQSRSGAIGSNKNGNNLRVHRGMVKRETTHSSSHEQHRLLTPIFPSRCSNESHLDLKSITHDEDDHVSRNLSMASEKLSRENSIKSRYTIDRQLILDNFNRRCSKYNEGQCIMKETRAAKTVAIIVGCFILCWTPFFVCYVIQGVSKIKIHAVVFHIFIWIGYVNSLINPFIYALFSNDYRHAFKKILRCKVKSSVSRREGVMRYIASLRISSSGTRNEICMSAMEK